MFVTVSDPVGVGFVATLSHPGANITGFVNLQPRMGGKWLEFLKEIAPKIQRVAIMFTRYRARRRFLFSAVIRGRRAIPWRRASHGSRL